MLDQAYYLPLAAAYARGALGDLPVGLPDEAAFEAGRARGLDLHTFKRSMVVPRVRAALSALKALAPADLLDIGGGRGAFLWPLMDEMPWLPVTSVEYDGAKAAFFAAVARGGQPLLEARQGDATGLPYLDGSFDVVTILEVLEHLRDPDRAAREAVRVARRAVVATVPSRPDDNPEHIHLFDPDRLSRMFSAAGARKVKVEEVQGSFVALAQT